MGLTSFEGGRVRRGDVTVAKNYLQQPEIDTLNRIVVMYLDYAENMAEQRKTMTMSEWEDRLDAFLQFNERDVLKHAGKIRADVAERLALDRYAQFDANRREAERLADDVADAEALERLGKALARSELKKDR